MLCTSQSQSTTVMKPLLLTLLLTLLVNKYQMCNLCSFEQTITNTHIYRSLYKQHDCVCGCCHSDSCPHQNWGTGWGFGVIDSDDVRTMSSACKPWAPAAQNGKLPAPPPLHVPSLSLSLDFSLHLLSHLSFLNTPILLLFSIPLFLSPIPLLFSHTGNMHPLRRKISAGAETIIELNSALCGSA